MTERMQTDDLIAQLAADPVAAPRARPEARLAPRLALGMAGMLALFGTLLGPRPDLMAALSDPVVLAKTVLPLALALMALPIVLRSARPGMGSGWTAQAVWVLPATAAALFVLAFVTHAPGERLRLFIGHSIPVCMPAILTLSLPVTAGLIAALRGGAAISPSATGALAGLVAGGFATTVYSTFCIEDSPLFYAVWYSLGIALAAGAGALAGRRWLRW